MRGPSYDLRPCTIGEVKALCALYHGYGGAGNMATYAFGVYESAGVLLTPSGPLPLHDRLVAAYSWQPPAPGAAKSVCPTCPEGVLMLSRMVAVPRNQRILNHVSRPLRRQMRDLIDRTRWPVLLTYSDEGEGHTGHVYKCSGWQETTRAKRPTYENAQGVRVSTYREGHHDATGLTRVGSTWIQRWERKICDDPAAWMRDHGWRRVPVPGKFWRSGAQAHTYIHVDLLTSAAPTSTIEG
jgi:hypothetical protein